jgi:hypothetical protein
MVLPGLAGYWLDQRLGTGYLVGVGFVLGFVTGVWHLLTMTGAVKGTRAVKGAKQRPSDPPDPPPK